MKKWILLINLLWKTIVLSIKKGTNYFEEFEINPFEKNEDKKNSF